MEERAAWGKGGGAKMAMGRILGVPKGGYKRAGDFGKRYGGK